MINNKIFIRTLFLSLMVNSMSNMIQADVRGSYEKMPDLDSIFHKSLAAGKELEEIARRVKGLESIRNAGYENLNEQMADEIKDTLFAEALGNKKIMVNIVPGAREPIDNLLLKYPQNVIIKFFHNQRLQELKELGFGENYFEQE